MKKILHKIIAFLAHGAELKPGKKYVVLASNC
jgi:hypothetical protein